MCESECTVGPLPVRQRRRRCRSEMTLSTSKGLVCSMYLLLCRQCDRRIHSCLVRGLAPGDACSVQVTRRSYPSSRGNRNAATGFSQKIDCLYRTVRKKWRNPAKKLQISSEFRVSREARGFTRPSRVVSALGDACSVQVVRRAYPSSRDSSQCGDPFSQEILELAPATPAYQEPSRAANKWLNEHCGARARWGGCPGSHQTRGTGTQDLRSWSRSGRSYLGWPGFDSARTFRPATFRHQWALKKGSTHQEQAGKFDTATPGPNDTSPSWGVHEFPHLRPRGGYDCCCNNGPLRSLFPLTGGFAAGEWEKGSGKWPSM